jgi:hypothetical protein
MTHRIQTLWIFVALSGLIGFVNGAEPTDHADAEPELIIARLIQQAGINLTNQHAAAIAYYRTNITEEYNSKGQVRERKETVKKVVLRDGKRTTELVLYNGRAPSTKELKKETQRKTRRRTGKDQKDAPDRSRQINGYITQEIMSRFVFDVIGQETVDEHPCYIVSFKPSPEQEKPNKIFDRVINKMGGIIWVHSTEYEMVKADIQLRERVKMWGGVLAALDRISLKILRTRREDGFWIDKDVAARFSGRAFTKRIDVMTWDFTSPPIFLEASDSEKPIVAAE